MEGPQRAELESWLESGEMEAVRELCRAFRVPRDEWPEHSFLSGFVDLALRRFCDDLLVSLRARSETQAIQLAAPRCGMKAETVQRRWRRYRTAS